MGRNPRFSECWRVVGEQTELKKSEAGELAVRKLRRTPFAMIWFVAAIASAPVGNQTDLEHNIELLRADVRYEKTNWIRSNLRLTEREAGVLGCCIDGTNWSSTTMEDVVREQ